MLIKIKLISWKVSQSSNNSFCLSVCLFVFLFFFFFLDRCALPSQPKHSYVHKIVHFRKIQFCRHSDKSLECYDIRRWYHTEMEKRCIGPYL